MRINDHIPNTGRLGPVSACTPLLSAKDVFEREKPTCLHVVTVHETWVTALHCIASVPHDLRGITQVNSSNNRIPDRWLSGLSSASAINRVSTPL